MTNTHSERKIITIAFITAFALTIYLFEMLIPKPLPFIKLGLTNVVILTLIYSDMPIEAIVVTVAKTLAGGFISGTIFSPTTLLSFTGGFSALIVMVLCYYIKTPFSMIGVSILSSVTHNIAQLITINQVIIREDKILYLLPVLILLGILTGFLTGYFSHLLITKINFRRFYERPNH